MFSTREIYLGWLIQNIALLLCIIAIAFIRAKGPGKLYRSAVSGKLNNYVTHADVSILSFSGVVYKQIWSECFQDVAHDYSTSFCRSFFITPTDFRQIGSNSLLVVYLLLGGHVIVIHTSIDVLSSHIPLHIKYTVKGVTHRYSFYGVP